MDNFDLLETRIIDLLSQLDQLQEEIISLRANALGLAPLREENRALLEELATIKADSSVALQELTQENENLTAALETERQNKSKIDERITALLAKVQQSLGD